jgi:hypothetical protein
MSRKAATSPNDLLTPLTITVFSDVGMTQFR